jgi:light-regulated signal transduction histidine kinase (bacteriophytochrome)
VLSGAIDAGAAASPVLATGASAAADNPRSNNYFADMLLRSPNGEGATSAEREEITRIIVADLAAGKINADDRGYLAQLVAKRSGLAQADAEKRVDQVYAQAQQAAADAKAKAMAAAEEARKAAARSALWMTFALLLGAFVASFSATIGGRNRDHARVVTRTVI